MDITAGNKHTHKVFCHSTVDLIFLLPNPLNAITSPFNAILLIRFILIHDIVITISNFHVASGNACSHDYL